VVNVEPIGTLRLPSINLLDVRAGKRFPVGAGRALELRVDVYNALNINTVVGRNVQSGASFLALVGGTSALGAGASSIVTPRILQLGASFTF